VLVDGADESDDLANIHASALWAGIGYHSVFRVEFCIAARTKVTARIRCQRSIHGTFAAAGREPEATGEAKAGNQPLRGY